MATKPPRKPFHCYWCKRILEAATAPSRVAHTKDHVVPKSRGGRKTVPCCRQCNHLKGDWPPEYWRMVMRVFPNWTKQFRTRGEIVHAVKVRVAEHKREKAKRGLWPQAVKVPLRQIEYREAA